MCAQVDSAVDMASLGRASDATQIYVCPPPHTCPPPALHLPPTTHLLQPKAVVPHRYTVHNHLHLPRLQRGNRRGRVAVQRKALGVVLQLHHRGHWVEVALDAQVWLAHARHHLEPVEVGGKRVACAQAGLDSHDQLTIGKRE